MQNCISAVKRFVSVLLIIILLITVFAGSVVPSASAANVANPQFKTIEAIDGGIKFTWDSRGSDVLYRVYWKASNGWRRMTTTSNTSFVERDVHAGKGYTYTIRCLDKNESSFISDFNSSGWYIKYYDMPVVSQVKSTYHDNGTYTYRFSWTNTASKYNIEMRYAGETKWRPVAANYKGTSYEHTPVSNELDDATRLRTYRVYATDGKYKLSEAGVSPYHMPKNASDSLAYRPMISDAAGWYYALMWSMDLYDTDFSECPGYHSDDSAVMKKAYDHGFYTAGTRERLISLRNSPPTRQFIANSLKLAYQYPTKPISSKHNASVNTSMLTRSGDYYYAKDTTDRSINTAAHYGWFLPDYYGMLYPNRLVTADEMDYFIECLTLYKKWHGKTLVAFGDSIMHGSGDPINSGQGYKDTLADNQRNDFAAKRFPRYDYTRFEGLCDMIGTKFGMKHRDYSYPGSTIAAELVRNTDGASSAKWQFAYDAPYKSHVANQVRAAIKEGQKADLILFNGGTNDTGLPHVSYSTNKTGRVYDYDYCPANEYSGWSERTAYHNQYGQHKTLLPEYYETESSFQSGFIKAMQLMTGTDSEAADSKMKNASIIHVRSQEMNWGSLYNQKVFGKKGIELARKYGCGKTYSVDMYRSGFDANYSFCYNYYISDINAEYSRGIHPNSRGYAKFFLPQIEEQMLNIE